MKRGGIALLQDIWQSRPQNVVGVILCWTHFMVSVGMRLCLRRLANKVHCLWILQSITYQPTCTAIAFDTSAICLWVLQTIAVVSSSGFSGIGITMGGDVFSLIWNTCLTDFSFAYVVCSQHAGAQCTYLKNIPAIPISAFVAAVQEYKESSETDDDSDMVID